jgi:hypothetical protein
VPGLLLTIPYTAVQFVALQQCKEAAAKLGWTGEACKCSIQQFQQCSCGFRPSPSLPPTLFYPGSLTPTFPNR